MNFYVGVGIIADFNIKNKPCGVKNLCKRVFYITMWRFCRFATKQANMRLFYNSKQKGLAKSKKHVYIDYTNPSLDITTKGNDDDHDLHSKRGIRRLSCLSFKKGQTDEHYLYPKRKIRWMNRPFLLIIAFAVLAFNVNTAWANSTENMPIWEFIPEPLLSPLAILGAASIAWVIAIWTILANKKIQRRRVTVAYMSHLSWDGDYTEVRKKFLELKAQGIHFSKIAEDYHALPDKKHNAKQGKLSLKQQTIIDNHDIIRKILNEYESMAIAIRMGVYDKKIIKISRRQIILSDLRMSGSFIGTIRKKLKPKNAYETPDAIYKECCTLYKKWTGEELQIRS